MSTNTSPPRPVGPPVNLGLGETLTGCLLPWDAAEGQPVLLNAIGADGFYLAVFSTEIELRTFMTAAGLEFDAIKKVTDGAEFFDSLIKEDVKLILNPYYTPEGRVRFMQLFADEEARRLEVSKPS